jgi:hypothetical protein
MNDNPKNDIINQMIYVSNAGLYELFSNLLLANSLNRNIPEIVIHMLIIENIINKI